MITPTNQNSHLFCGPRGGHSTSTSDFFAAAKRPPRGPILRLHLDGISGFVILVFCDGWGDLVHDQHFEKPVHVRLGSGGQVRVVHTAKEAAECLVKYRWPKATGVKHRRARKACLDVLSGLKKAAAARKAFEAAAIESDILISSPTLSAASLEGEQSWHADEHRP